MNGEIAMPTDRSTELCIAQTALPLPCFFPSVSSVKTNLMPVDYVELLDAAAYPLFLVSAYDIGQRTNDQRPRIDAALARSKERGSVILMDSGNYERFWKDDAGCGWKSSMRSPAPAGTIYASATTTRNRPAIPNP